MPAMATLRDIRSGLASHSPLLLDGTSRAAVALVLRERANGPEVLLIERSRKENDPWSGHMAFPGGRLDTGETVEQAARRETHEEVGLSLHDADPLGRLDDLTGRRAGASTGLVISAFVFHHHGETPLVYQEAEVAEALWVPVSALSAPDRHIHKAFHGTGGMAFPGIVVGDPDRHIVWGLTYRFIEVFHRVVGRPFPNRWGAIEGSVK
jgi:8-oxo-dGTP pyrophosphatase MutT (NUDIX family)